MNELRLISLLLCVASSAAASPARHTADPKRNAALELVKGQLKDPSSAQFKGVKSLKADGTYYCGWVNAKNSYGGYDGFAVFYVHDGKVILLSPDTSTPGMC